MFRVGFSRPRSGGWTDSDVRKQLSSRRSAGIGAPALCCHPDCAEGGFELNLIMKRSKVEIPGIDRTIVAAMQGGGWCYRVRGACKLLRMYSASNIKKKRPQV